MKITNLLAKTLREIPKDATDIKSHGLLIKAGYIRQLSSGIYTYMHLAQRSIRKIEQILREEMDRIGGVEICMPVVHPSDIWEITNRYNEIDDSLVRFRDRKERNMVLAMTHEEVVASLTKSEINSYKQLPVIVYQIQTKFRDEARARGGLIRVREFTMKDSYSLAPNYEILEEQYIKHYNAYFKIAARMDLPVIAVKSDVGMMGGKVAHEFMYVTDIGEDTIFICNETGYKANKEVATFHKSKKTNGENLNLNLIHTPNCSSIDDLGKSLNKEKSSFGKTRVYKAEVDGNSKIILAVVRGDMEVNEVKLQKIIKAKTLQEAEEADVKNYGIVLGYTSPIKISQFDDVIVVVDDLIPNTNNLIMGANKIDYHYENVCFGRDYNTNYIGDIVSAFDGAISPDGKYKLKAVRGVEVGNIFQLGTKYTDAFNATYLNENGKSESIIMGSYGIGVGRLLACIIEEHNDTKGLKLPISIAPYNVYIVSSNDNDQTIAKSNELYQSLISHGHEVLYDNRPKKVASFGVRMKDAELVGIPIILIISKKSIEKGGVEIRLRQIDNINHIVPFEEVLDFVSYYIKKLQSEIEQKAIQSIKWGDGEI